MRLRQIITVALGHQVQYTYAETEAKNFGAMLEMQTKHGVKIKRWPDSILAQFEKAWVEVVAEESAKDALFKKVADSFYGCPPPGLWILFGPEWVGA